MTNQVNQAFEKWLKENYPDYPPPLSEVWQAATKASESEINSLKERVAELESELFVLQELRKNQATLGLELTASNNQLREALNQIGMEGYKDQSDLNTIRKVIELSKEAISKTPAQSLAEHDNEVIERCAKVIENGNFLTDKSTEAMLAKCASKAIRALKVTP